MVLKTRKEVMVRLKITKNINDFVIYSNSLNKTKHYCSVLLQFRI